MGPLRTVGTYLNPLPMMVVVVVVVGDRAKATENGMWPLGQWHISSILYK